MNQRTEETSLQIPDYVRYSDRKPFFFKPGLSRSIFPIKAPIYVLMNIPTLTRANMQTSQQSIHSQ